MTLDASRRAFLQRASALSVAGIATPWAINLAAMGEAAASTATDYKALVCIFLYGGNDYGNTLIPYDNARYTIYQGMRPTLAYAQADLAATVLAPSVALPGGDQYALAPELAPLLPLFSSNKLAVMLNVGTLVQPTAKADYTAKSVPLPPKLFSHNDQQSVWQSSAPEGATSGWGGRMGDLFVSGNGNATFTCVNVSSNAVFLSGRTAVQYQVSSTGPVALNGVKSPLFGSTTCSNALQALVTAPRTHLFESEYTRVMSRSLVAGDALTAAFAGGPTINTVFPADNGLADQLEFVARMISTSNEVGAKRQVFFVSLGGFDNHDGLASIHPGLLTSVADAMSAFHAATVELGVANQVTTFTASDFGRTLTGSNGSDHGWGSMHFMLGGAVHGGRFYGAVPEVANDGPDDVGQGRLLPSTSVDQYAATLGKWFGISDSNLLSVLPNLVHWNASDRNLGFV
ncbi:MAG TPA: DUF1501 domain-containing protein [Burkholderiales bacterium]|nr:DUF1501 domain-containing protein [Burkholderiales bacterium]